MVKPAVMIAGMCLLSAGVASATTILDTNFDSANGSYSDGNIINSAGATNEQLTVKLSSAAQTAGSALNVVNGRLEFTDNASTDGSVAAGPSIVKDLTSAGSVGYQKTYDQLTIKFDLTPLASGVRPKLLILVNDGSFTSSSTASAVYMIIDAGGNIYYNNGSSGLNAGVLTTNTTYHFEIDLNYATGKWDLSATSTNTPITVTGINTRANVTTTSYSAGYFVMNGGTNGSSTALSTPFVGVDNLSIVASSTTAAVPEPAAFSLLAIGVAGLLLGRRSR